MSMGVPRKTIVLREEVQRKCPVTRKNLSKTKKLKEKRYMSIGVSRKTNVFREGVERKCPVTIQCPVHDDGAM